MAPIIGILGWEAIALTVALISFGIVTLFYMFALAFNLPGLKGWCKSEYTQVLVSVLLIAFLYLLINVGLTTASKFTFTLISESTTGNVIIDPDSPTGEPIKGADNRPIDIRNSENPLTTNHFAVAQLYLRRAMSCEKRIYIDVFWANAFIEIAEKFSIGNAGVEPVAGWPLSGVVSLAHYFTNTLTFALIAQYFQLHLLRFAEATMLTIFLPIGIVLRAFPLFRGAGGLLIAISLGFYLVFPLSLVMVSSLRGDINSSCALASPSQLAQFDETCNQSPSDAALHIARAQSFFDSGGSDWYSRLKAFVGLAIVQAILYPLVAFVITFTFIRSTSAMFGADLAEIGRGLIKLI